MDPQSKISLLNGRILDFTTESGWFESQLPFIDSADNSRTDNGSTFSIQENGHENDELSFGSENVVSIANRANGFPDTIATEPNPNDKEDNNINNNNSIDELDHIGNTPNEDASTTIVALNNNGNNNINLGGQQTIEIAQNNDLAFLQNNLENMDAHGESAPSGGTDTVSVASYFGNNNNNNNTRNNEDGGGATMDTTRIGALLFPSTRNLDTSSLIVSAAALVALDFVADDETKNLAIFGAPVEQDGDPENDEEEFPSLFHHDDDDDDDDGPLPPNSPDPAA